MVVNVAVNMHHGIEQESMRKDALDQLRCLDYGLAIGLCLGFAEIKNYEENVSYRPEGRNTRSNFAKFEKTDILEEVQSVKSKTMSYLLKGYAVGDVHSSRFYRVMTDLINFQIPDDVNGIGSDTFWHVDSKPSDFLGAHEKSEDSSHSYEPLLAAEDGLLVGLTISKAMFYLVAMRHIDSTLTEKERIDFPYPYTIVKREMDKSIASLIEEADMSIKSVAKRLAADYPEDLVYDSGFYKIATRLVMGCEEVMEKLKV